MQTVEQLLKEDVWAVAKVEHPTGCGIIRFRSPVLGPEGVSEFHRLVCVCWVYAAEGSGQMPDNAVSDEMGRFEDYFREAVQEDLQGILTAVVTFDGMRQWVYYTRDVAEFGRRLSAIPDYHGEPYPIQLTSNEDPTWSYLRDQVLRGIPVDKRGRHANEAAKRSEFLIGDDGGTLSVHLVAEEMIQMGRQVVLEGLSPGGRFGVVFEDDGKRGYLYGVDFSKADNPILDALHVYNVEQSFDGEKLSKVQLFWSNDGLKAMLLIDGSAHAVFDFEAKRGYCRTGFPPPMSEDFSVQGHGWDDAAMKAFM